jgi:hypothetical protein
MMTIKKAATIQFEGMIWNPHSDRTSPSMRRRIVIGHCERLRVLGLVMPAIIYPLLALSPPAIHS